MSNIKERFSKQVDSWTDLTTDEERVEFCTEMIKTSSKTEPLRIYAKKLNDNVFSNKDFVKSLSDFIDCGGTVKILTTQVTKEEIRSSALLVRAAFFQFEENMQVEVKTATVVYNMTEKDGENIPIDFMLNHEAFFVDPNDKSTPRASISCTKGGSVVQQLTSLFDMTFDKEETKKVDLLAILETNK